jgi:tetratricopeptide (TPR) repeat protein
LYNIAQNLFYLGRYEEAKGLLEKVTILAPHYSATPYYLALSESKIGNHEKALQIIKKAQIDFPNEKVMYKDALTVIYADMKDKDKFVSDMLDLLNLGANPAGVYRRIIMQLESWGMMEEANKYKNIAGEKGIKLY